MIDKLLCIVQSYDQPACRELQIWLSHHNVKWTYGEQHYTIDVTKNRIVKTFLDLREFDHLLCIANDMVPLSDTKNILEAPGDLVYCESLSGAGQLQHAGDYQFNAAAWRASRRCLEAMGAPWFKMGTSADLCQNSYCDCNHFLRKSQEAGYDSKPVAHMGHATRMILIPDPEKPREKWQAIFPNQWKVS